MLQHATEVISAVVPFARGLLGGGQVGAQMPPPNICTAHQNQRAASHAAAARAASASTPASPIAMSPPQIETIAIEKTAEAQGDEVTEKPKKAKTAKTTPRSRGRGRGRSARKARQADDDSSDDSDDEFMIPDVHDVPIFAQASTLLGYAILMIMGHLREYYRAVRPDSQRRTAPGYAPLVRDFDDFYTRRLYYRIRDCWNRPIDTRPGRTCGVMERESSDYNKTFTFTGTSIPCVNMASYNYLGFAEDLPAITDDNLAALQSYGIGACSSALEGGRSDVMRQLEEETAEHVGKDAACVYAMGFGTNFSGLPALFAGDGTLVISDSLNHASLVAGVRLSSGRVKVFPHNDYRRLDKIIRQAIVDGQPRTHRSWNRIVLLVEGVYSMEGEILNLPQIVKLKKKYNCLLYVDEAHSIGALGATGRGVCEHWGVDPADVDVLMGTYTKSFGSIGGYIAADRATIKYMRQRSGAALMGDTLHSAAAQQALSSLRVIGGKDGTTVGKDKIAKLAENSKYLRQGLIKLGVMVYGDDDSPVIPMMIFNPAKMPAFSRECLKRNLAVVVVGYPATTLIESRVRFCVSAAHTKADLDRVIETVDEVAKLVPLRYCKPWYLFKE